MSTPSDIDVNISIFDRPRPMTKTGNMLRKSDYEVNTIMERQRPFTKMSNNSR